MESVRSNPKKPRFRDRKYLDWIREQPCVITGSVPCDPAHLRWGQSGGLGLKPPDDMVVPLAPELHRLQHQIGEVKFWVQMANEHPSFLMRLLQGHARLHHDRYERDKD